MQLHDMLELGLGCLPVSNIIAQRIDLKVAIVDAAMPGEPGKNASSVVDAEAGGARRSARDRNRQQSNALVATMWRKNRYAFSPSESWGESSDPVSFPGIDVALRFVCFRIRDPIADVAADTPLDF